MERGHKKNSARPRRFTESLLWQETQTYRASRRHLRATSEFVHPATVKNRNSDLTRGATSLAHMIAVCKSQQRGCTTAAGVSNILATWKAAVTARGPLAVPRSRRRFRR